MKIKGLNGALVDSLRDFTEYVQYELRLDIEYAFLYIIGPMVLTGFILYGSLGFLGDIYRLVVPPTAPELHR